MAKKQTRRSISVRPDTYAGAVELAAKLGGGVSTIVEELIDAAMTAHGIERMTRADAIALRERLHPTVVTEPEAPIVSAHFTF